MYLIKDAKQAARMLNVVAYVTESFHGCGVELHEACQRLGRVVVECAWSSGLPPFFVWDADGLLLFFLSSLAHFVCPAGAARSFEAGVGE